MKQKQIILLILIALLIGGGIWMWERGNRNKEEQHFEGYWEKRLNDPSLPLMDTSDWIVYNNTDFHFTLKHPADYKVTESSSDIGGQTVARHFAIAPKTTIVPEEATLTVTILFRPESDLRRADILKHRPDIHTANFDAIDSDKSPQPGLTVYVKRDDDVFMLSNGDYREETQHVIENMISTLHFGHG